MLSFSLIAAIVLSYVCILFAIAFYIDKNHHRGHSFVNHPVIYSLSLAVYCTSWTYYGSVGSAGQNGLLYLTIYLGPMITITLWWGILRKMVRIKNRFRITSIVDFVSARYDKSEGIGLLAGSLVVMGTIPYIALQLKAIITTTGLMVGGEVHNIGPWTTKLDLIGPAVVCLMAIFTIFFGIRKLDTTERHPGMIFVLVVECVVKLIAFLCVGIFVTYFLNDGIDSLVERIPEAMGPSYPFLGIRDMKDMATWVTYLILSSSAILFLPRQFHVAVVENTDEKHIKTASWLFPLYLLLINLFVLPIAISGKLAGLDAAQADNYVLMLPMINGKVFLSILTFLGGFSAAMGMIMISNIAVSTIITNNILLPILTRVKPLNFLTKHILTLRWAVAAINLTFAYSYLKVVGEEQALLSIGMVSFAAALQFMPVIIGSLFWKKGSRSGCYLALLSGMSLWFYTLIIPALAKGNWIDREILDNGLFSLSFLKPEELFGFNGYHPLTNAVFWTMFFNIGSYIIGSLLFTQSESEKRIAEEFVEVLPKDESFDPSLFNLAEDISLIEKIFVIRNVLILYLSPSETERNLRDSLERLGVQGKKKISLLKLAELHEDIERVLAGAIGTAAAYTALEKIQIITPEEREGLSHFYGNLMAQMKINPRELNKKIILYQEKEKLMKRETQLLEEAINKKEIELEEQKSIAFQASKMSALGEMAGGIAHEINNPLTIISSTATIMEKMHSQGKLSDELLISSIGNIKKTLLRISKIINGLRTVTRNSKDDYFEDVCIRDILVDVLGLSSERFRSFGIDLQIELDNKIFDEEIYCDRVQLSQVLINLLGNSFDAVETLETKWVKVEAMTDGFQYTLSVSDSGRGIPKEVKDKIFQPFYTSKAVGKGTGLGLSISSKIIEKMEGTLSIDETSPHTTFIIRLPLKRRAV